MGTATPPPIYSEINEMSHSNGPTPATPPRNNVPEWIPNPTYGDINALSAREAIFPDSVDTSAMHPPAQYDYIRTHEVVAQEYEQIPLALNEPRTTTINELYGKNYYKQNPV